MKIKKKTVPFPVFYWLNKSNSLCMYWAEEWKMASVYIYSDLYKCRVTLHNIQILRSIEFSKCVGLM